VICQPIKSLCCRRCSFGQKRRSANKNAMDAATIATTTPKFWNVFSTLIWPLLEASAELYDFALGAPFYYCPELCFWAFSVLFKSFAAVRCSCRTGRVLDANCFTFGSEPYCASFLNSLTSFS